MNTSVNNISKTLFLAMLTILVACSETDKTTVSTDSDIEVTFVEEAGALVACLAIIAFDVFQCESG